MYTLKNKVQLIGHLGNAPEIKNTESDKKYARFSIATNESYRNAKGEKVTETTWHNLVAWGKIAGIVEKYLNKGSEIAIEGKLISRSYTDKDGVKKYITEVVAWNHQSQPLPFFFGKAIFDGLNNVSFPARGYDVVQISGLGIKRIPDLA